MCQMIQLSHFWLFIQRIQIINSENISTTMIIAVLFTIAKICKKTWVPINQWMDKI